MQRYGQLGNGCECVLQNKPSICSGNMCDNGRLRLLLVLYVGAVREDLGEYRLERRGLGPV